MAVNRVWMLLSLAVAGCTVAPSTEPPLRVATTEAARLAAARAELEATFAARNRAFESKDYDTLVAQISPDYTAVLPDGRRMTRDDLATYLRRNLDRWVRIVRQSNMIESIRLEGDRAILDMRQDLARIQIVDGREALVESGVLQTETWTRTPDGWKLLSVRDEREQSLRVNGQPFNQGR